MKVVAKPCNTNKLSSGAQHLKMLAIVQLKTS